MNGFACPICAGSTFHSYKLGLVQCSFCDVVLSPSVWQQGANKAMEEKFFGEDYISASSVWVELFESWNNKKTLARVARSHSPGHRLLEIGVGSGSFLNAARTSGYEVMGCDLSGPICRQVRHKYGITTHNVPVTTLMGRKNFDVIVMNHVLEHTNEPIELLRGVEQLLTPDGLLHIVVPNIACWEATLSGWVSYEPYHLTYFTPQTLKKTISATGLEMISFFTYDSFSGWFLALLRTALRVNRAGGTVTLLRNSLIKHVKHRSSILEHAYRIAMVLFGGAIWPLRWLQSKLGYGDEMVCIARKKDLVNKRRRADGV